MDYNGKLYLIDAATGTTRWSTERTQDRNSVFPSNSPLGAGFYTCGAVAFSPDGTRLAAGGSNGWLGLFDVATGNVRWSTGFGAEIRALRFTPDGARLAVGAGDWKFRMLNAQSGATIWSADNEFWPLFFIAMDSSASLVGSGGKDGEFQLWDAASGRLQWKKSYPSGSFVSGGGISDDRSRIVVSNWGFGVYGYDGNGNSRWFRSLSNANIAVTPDGKYIFAVGYTAQRAPRLILMDENGTVLWEYRPAHRFARCRRLSRGTFSSKHSSRNPEPVQVW